MKQDGILPKLIPKQLRTRRVIFALLLLAGIPILWLWRSQPATMTLVGRQTLSFPPVSEDVSYECVTSIQRDSLLYVRIFTSKACQYTLFDMDGTRRWSVMRPAPSDPFARGSRYDKALSPDGCYFTTVLPQRVSQRILTWRNGTLYGDITLPFRARLAIPHVLDSGKVLCTLDDGPHLRLFLLDRNRIAATGTMVLRPPYSSYLSEDGTILVTESSSRLTYHRVSIHGSIITLIPMVHATGSQPILMNSGLLVTDEGAVYTAKGKRFGPSGWHRYPGCFSADTVVIQHSGFTPPMNNHYKQFRIFNPQSGNAWKVPHGQPALHCAATPDGQFAMVEEYQQRKIQQLARQISGVIPGRLGSRLLARSYCAEYRLYERPGRVRARLPLIESRGDGLFIYYDNSARRYYTIAEIPVLSPDGHTIRFITENAKQQTCLLTFCW